MGYTFHDPKTIPKPFDIAWCKFPYRGQGMRPGPVARPVLVLASTTVQCQIEGKTQDVGILVVQYGGDFTLKDVPNNLHVAADEFRGLGLHKPTVFRMDLGNRARLVWCEEYFVPQGYLKQQKIVAGHLNADQEARAIACLKARGLAYPLPPIT
jgi:hypothetical protein